MAEVLKAGDKELKHFKTEKILLTEIIRDKGTQARQRMDPAYTRELADAMKEGATLPPVMVVVDADGKLYLVDGFHRYLANERLGYTEGDADLYKGTLRDAILASVGRNTSHGLRRTNDDKNKAVERLLEDEEWTRFSNNRIAQLAGVSDTFVANVAARLGIDRNQVVGADGRVQKTANTGSKSGGSVSKEAKQAAEAGAQAEAVTVDPKAPLTDRVGNTIPEKLDAVFSMGPVTVNKIVGILKQAGIEWKGGVERLDIGGNEPLKGIVRHGKAVAGEISAVIANIKREVLPYAVCPYCKARDEAQAVCKACESLGWVSEEVYSRAPERFKETGDVAPADYWQGDEYQKIEADAAEAMQDSRTILRRLKSVEKEAEKAQAKADKEIGSLKEKLEKAEQKIQALAAPSSTRPPKAPKSDEGVDAATAALQSKAAKKNGNGEALPTAAPKPTGKGKAKAAPTEPVATAPETEEPEGMTAEGARAEAASDMMDEVSV